ncbi:NYN domain-containing protein [Emticicia sp. SJ17W-69]|uniref:NYN domain-containing protein n=1 Tax=Emticicia sp. SJ17W-69 TaxID=3421657 RepID=UPI003EBECB44
MDTPKELKLAVLIDADNVPYANIKGMLEEIAKYGTPTFKRIYGDWTNVNLSGWKNVLLENAITPIQQYSYTKGKNSTDSALIIDAMDILYTGGVEGFCIVSSDSDFTRLATRLREAGMKVFGIGEKKTPSPFIASCNKFIYIEILKKEVREPIPVKVNQKKTAKKSKKPTAIVEKIVTPPIVDIISEPETTPTVAKIDQNLIKLILDSINDIAEEDGWVFLGVLGNLIPKKQPDFDARNYGYKKLLDLIKAIPEIEIDKRTSGTNNISHFFVRIK